jgi:oligopeptide/dipeptide ABC transporter ATP-binding protein
LRSPSGIVAVVAITILVFLAVAAPTIWGHSANSNDIAAINGGPSRGHLLGTDGLGRDVLARVLVATRLSLELAVEATLIGTVGGVILGSLPVVAGRRVRRLLVGFVNLTVAFPGLLLALFLAVVFGIGAKGAVLAIGVATVPFVARLTYNLSASVSSADYMSAARILGVRRHRLLVRHVLPNIAEPLLITATVLIGSSLLAFASLSFLGLGVQSPSYDWGELLNQGISSIYTNPAQSLAPGVAIVIAGLSFNLLGDILARLAGSTTTHRTTRRQKRRQAAPRFSAASPRSEAGRLTPVLAVEQLSVTFPSAAGPLVPVADVSFEVAAGEVVGIVGESGSGKSLTALAAAQLVTHPGVVSAAQLEFGGEDLRSSADSTRLRHLLGASLAMVFQDPLSSLNPAMRVGRQLAEVAEIHQGASRRVAWSRAVDRLRVVQLPAPERQAAKYPHELSGGMRQRAMIGIGLMGSPRLLIADEPTTALDVTVQGQILELLEYIREDQGTAVLLISHDVAVVSQMSRRILVMYAGRIVEDLPASALVDDAAHPYTVALVDAVPDMETNRDRPLATIPGRPPNLDAVPTGCAFSPRCPFATDHCTQERPPLVDRGAGRKVACWHPQNRGEVVSSSAGAKADRLT